MKNAILSAAVVAALAVSVWGTAWGQNQGTAATASTESQQIALIDMAQVFKQYKKFEVLREELKGEVAKSEAEAKAMAEKVVKLQQEMKQYTEGSPEFLKTEQDIARLASEFETFRKIAQRDFLRQEAQIYHTVYLEAQEAVRLYAEYWKVPLVLRFSSEELDTSNPQNLIQGMNRQVVYYRDQDDITKPVVDYLNKKYSGAAAAGSAAGAAAPRSAVKPAAAGAATPTRQ